MINTKKLIACLASITLMTISTTNQLPDGLNIETVPINSSAKTKVLDDVKVEWSIDDLLSYEHTLCPVAGFYRGTTGISAKKIDSAFVIYPNGECYMRKLKSGGTEISGKCQVTVYKSDFNGNLSVLFDTRHLVYSRFDVSKKDAIELDMGAPILMEFKNETESISAFGNNAKLLSNENDPNYIRTLNYNMGHFETYNPGDVYQDKIEYKDKFTPELTDLTAFSANLLGNKKLFPYHFNWANSDINMDGKINQKDVDLLKEFILKKRQSLDFTDDFMYNTYFAFG